VRNVGLCGRVWLSGQGRVDHSRGHQASGRKIGSCGQSLARRHGPASSRDQDHVGQWEPRNVDYQCAGHVAALHASRSGVPFALGVETHYDILKNHWELENLSGIRPEVIAQEHQATVVTSHMAPLVEHEAQRRWEKRRARGEVRRKHAKDKINTSVAVGLWKDRWIKIVWDPDPDRRTQAYWHLVESMQANVVPIIPGQSYPQ